MVTYRTPTFLHEIYDPKSQKMCSIAGKKSERMKEKKEGNRGMEDIVVGGKQGWRESAGYREER